MTPTKREDQSARKFADRLILEKLTELYEVVKPSEIADLLQSKGIGLSAVRSLLASNPEVFAYAERRWVPASRLEGLGRPLSDAAYIVVSRYGAPMAIDLLAQELSRSRGREPEQIEAALIRLAELDPRFFITLSEEIGIDQFVFVARDEDIDRAMKLNGVTEEDTKPVQDQLKAIDWLDTDSVIHALEQSVPVSVKALGAVAWTALSPQDTSAQRLYDWKKFNGELLAIPGFIFSPDGKLHSETEASKWISGAVRLADKLAPTVEIEDAAPLELKTEDIEAAVARVLRGEDTTTAISILENQFEITPSVKTFPDDLHNVMTALKNDERVWWVGGDRFKKAGEAPDLVQSMPELFDYQPTSHLQEDGDPVDAELNDEGLSSSLRKLIVHPLATDVNDEEILPSPKNMPESLRLVLKPIHRELGTFPLCQFPTGWFEPTPQIQELIFINPDGDELQVWLNHEARLLFNLFDWWLDQQVESGAVFSLTKTNKPNVFEFAWLDQTDPVVYISSQRMEELREIASRSEDLSTFDILRDVMSHWPKGADFLTILWEVNVVRRTSRRLLASLLSSYVCFYQRSGSPVWHYDSKKVEQGFDKAKKKFIRKD
jgi:hypothetical protein